MSRTLFDFVGLMWFYSALVIAPLPWLIADETKRLVASGAVTAQERRRFVAGSTIVAYILAGSQVWFALATGNRNPLCEGADSASTVVNVMFTVLFALGLGWMWFADGAAFVARFVPVLLFSRKTYTARQVWWVVGVLALLLVVPLPMGKWQRSIQTTFCAEQRPSDPIDQWHWWLWQNRREA